MPKRPRCRHRRRGLGGRAGRPIMFGAPIPQLDMMSRRCRVLGDDRRMTQQGVIDRLRRRDVVERRRMGNRSGVLAGSPRRSLDQRSATRESGRWRCRGARGERVADHAERVSPSRPAAASSSRVRLQQEAPRGATSLQAERRSGRDARLRGANDVTRTGCFFIDLCIAEVSNDGRVAGARKNRPMGRREEVAASRGYDNLFLDGLAFVARHHFPLACIHERGEAKPRAR